MLNQQDNELLCRVGPGTPMGDLLRRYWHPVLLSEELSGPDCPPVRVKVMHEELVAFRDTNGIVGLLDNYCPHRRASLFFGRNEECGLRCVYHGWKFDVNGDCVDMPSEPAESNFKDKVKITAYPTRESAGMVWAYMGPKDLVPPFQNHVMHTVPADHVAVNKNRSYCNYLQGVEGHIDSAHIAMLHRNVGDDAPASDDGTDKPGHLSQALFRYFTTKYRTPDLQAEETPYGFRYAGIRPTDNGNQWVRITKHALPLTFFIPSDDRNTASSCFITVPMDDDSFMRYAVRCRLDRPFTKEEREGVAAARAVNDADGNRLRTPSNDYLIDRDAQRSKSITGIIGIPNQDFAVTESMGAVCDREHEHLGTSDSAIIFLRRLLLKAVRGLQEGEDPPGLDARVPFDKIRSEDMVIPPNGDWRELASEDLQLTRS